MIIKILGPGCPGCEKLEANARQAVEEAKLKNVEFEHVYEIDEIVSLGAMTVPAIIINNEIKAAGRIPEAEEIKKWLK